MAKGVPRRDGSGKGIRANAGRGGCTPIRSIGKGTGSIGKGTPK